LGISGYLILIGPHTHPPTHSNTASGVEDISLRAGIGPHTPPDLCGVPSRRGTWVLVHPRSVLKALLYTKQLRTQGEERVVIGNGLGVMKGQFNRSPCTQGAGFVLRTKFKLK
jgi:hypothetical protein